MHETLLCFGDEGSATRPPSVQAAAAPKGHIWDADADSTGLLSRFELKNGRSSIVKGGQSIHLPAGHAIIEQPSIRDLGCHGTLIFDALPKAVENAWIFNSSGQFQRSLELSGALEVTAFGPGFAVGFHPGGAAANGFPLAGLAETAGIAFFDGAGELIFSLNERLRPRRIEAQNIIAMARFGPTELIFIPESLWHGERLRDCPIAIYDWARDKLRWWGSPFLDALAVSGAGRFAYVFSPIGYDDEVLRLDLETLEIQSVGACADIYRGLDQGLFLAQIDSSTFSVVDPAASRVAPESAVFCGTSPHGTGSHSPGSHGTGSHGISSEGTGTTPGNGLKGPLKSRRSRARLEIVR
jgi:hypothetical protein